MDGKKLTVLVLTPVSHTCRHVQNSTIPFVAGAGAGGVGASCARAAGACGANGTIPPSTHTYAHPLNGV